MGVTVPLPVRVRCSRVRVRVRENIPAGYPCHTLTPSGLHADSAHKVWLRQLHNRYSDSTKVHADFCRVQAIFDRALMACSTCLHLSSPSPFPRTPITRHFTCYWCLTSYPFSIISRTPKTCPKRHVFVFAGSLSSPLSPFSPSSSPSLLSLPSPLSLSLLSSPSPLPPSFSLSSLSLSLSPPSSLSPSPLSPSSPSPLSLSSLSPLSFHFRYFLF